MSESDETLLLARRVFEIMNTQGVEAALGHIDPEFEMVTPPEFAAEPDTFRGHDGIRRWFSSFYEAMDEVRLEPDEMRQTDESRVAISCELTTRGRSSGIRSTQRAALLCELRDQRLLRIEFFATFEEALAAGAAG